MQPEQEADFRAFVSGRSPALLRTAYLLTGDWGLAEDLLQTTLIKTYLAWSRIREREAVEAYVRRTLANTAASWWRRRWRVERPTERLPECAIADLSLARAEQDEMWALVCRLPVRRRAVLVLRYYEDMSETDVAATLGITTGTVKSQTARALAFLRSQLTADALTEEIR